MNAQNIPALVTLDGCTYSTQEQGRTILLIPETVKLNGGIVSLKDAECTAMACGSLGTAMQMRAPLTWGCKAFAKGIEDGTLKAI